MCDRALLEKGLKNLDIKVRTPGINNILLFCRDLQKWNRRMNLIARDSPADVVIEKHFLDSLALVPVISTSGRENLTLLDVGTGAGFPGLVLAAVLPELSVTLVEPRAKRVVFLRHIVRLLHLENVRIIADRLEQADLSAGEFSYITSRAVADISRFLPMIEHLVTPETKVIVMCSTAGAEQGSEDTKLTSNWELMENICFKLPFSGTPRMLSILTNG